MLFTCTDHALPYDCWSYQEKLFNLLNDHYLKIDVKIHIKYFKY